MLSTSLFRLVFLAGICGTLDAGAQIFPNTEVSKLVGGDAAGPAAQGSSVSLSADGNTAVVGGPADHANQGAAWIYTRTGGIWNPVGIKLAGSGSTGAALQGWSVAISADGKTVIIGGYADNDGLGAAWIFCRNENVWTQEGPKLTGIGSKGAAQQGWSVALSADGNTALVGGYADNKNEGAAWVFTRSGQSWTQQGEKMVGSDHTYAAQQGYAVSLSAGGNTAMIGGYTDNGGQGAAWIFERKNGAWTQQGNKLRGTGAIGNAFQGRSVAISADGNSAIIGGFGDNGARGAAWIFQKNDGVWSQQGNKLTAAGNSGISRVGWSVAMNTNGSVALAGAPADNSGVGSAWVFTGSETLAMQQRGKLTSNGNKGLAGIGGSVSLNAAGDVAILGGSQDGGGQGAAWLFNAIAPVQNVPSPVIAVPLVPVADVPVPVVSGPPAGDSNPTPRAEVKPDTTKISELITENLPAIRDTGITPHVLIPIPGNTRPRTAISIAVPAKIKEEAGQVQAATPGRSEGDKNAGIKLQVNNLLTPNGDGKNDYLEVRNIDQYPNNTVQIIDRIGKTQFIAHNYANDWQGAMLPGGTYYYCIDLGNGSRPVKGFVTLLR